MASASGQSQVMPFQLAALLRPQQRIPVTVPGAGIANASGDIMRALMMRRLQGQEQAKREEAQAARDSTLQQIAGLLGGGPRGVQVASTEAGPPGIGAPPGATAPTLSAPAGPSRQEIARLLLGSGDEEFQQLGLQQLMRQPGGEAFTLSPGQSRFGPGGREIASVPSAPDETALMRNLQAAGIDPGSPEGQQIIRQAVTRPATQVNVGRPLTLRPGDIAVDPKTGRQIAKGGERPRKPFTEQQSKVAGFADRMIRAEGILQDLESQGFDPGSLGNAALGALPGGNIALSPEAQTYRQAQEDWVRAVLRNESGAVIGADEMRDEIKTFFPQPGDSPQVRQQKARSRQQRTQGLIRQSQGAYEALFGETVPTETTVTPNVEAAPPQPAARAQTPQASQDFSGMSANELLDLDITNLTNEQLKAYNDALEAALSGG